MSSQDIWRCAFICPCLYKDLSKTLKSAADEGCVPQIAISLVSIGSCAAGTVLLWGWCLPLIDGQGNDQNSPLQEWLPILLSLFHSSRYLLGAACSNHLQPTLPASHLVGQPQHIFSLLVCTSICLLQCSHAAQYSTVHFCFTDCSEKHCLGIRHAKRHCTCTITPPGVHTTLEKDLSWATLMRLPLARPSCRAPRRSSRVSRAICLSLACLYAAAHSSAQESCGGHHPWFEFSFRPAHVPMHLVHSVTEDIFMLRLASS